MWQKNTDVSLLEDDVLSSFPDTVAGVLFFVDANPSPLFFFFFFPSCLYFTMRVRVRNAFNFLDIDLASLVRCVQISEVKPNINKQTASAAPPRGLIING